MLRYLKEIKRCKERLKEIAHSAADGCCLYTLSIEKDRVHRRLILLKRELKGITDGKGK